MRYTYKEFIRFVSDRNRKIQLDDDMIWFNRIPVPKSLIERIFFGGEGLLSLYIDHLNSAIAVAIYDLINSKSILKTVPSSKYVTEESETIEEVFNEARKNDTFKELELFVINSSGLKGYEAISLDRFRKALSHNGKKYERIYIPKKIKAHVNSRAPKILQKIGTSNGDMFGNVLADELNIYRSGFSDAFASIFKEYLEFKFEHFSSLDPSLSALGIAQEEHLSGIGTLIKSRHNISSLWEPSLTNGGIISAVLNELHPLYLNDEIDTETRLKLIILALSYEEMHIIDIQEKQQIEAFRQRVSQTLRDFAATVLQTQ